jgi:hypothetical protein
MTTRSQVLKKSQVLSALVKTRQSILAEVSKLSNAQRAQIFLGIWSIKDLLAHLAGWDDTNREAAGYVLTGKLPPFYAHHDRDWAKYNARLVAKYKRDQMEELIELVKGSQRELIELLETIPPELPNKDFGVRFRGYKVTVQRLLEAELEDEQTHRQQTVDFLRQSK